VSEAPGLGAGVDNVRAVGEAVDDGFREPGVGEHLGPFSERQVGGHDQAAAFVSFGEDLEDELGGAVGQRQVAQLVQADEFGAGVAANDACELAAAVGFLQFVRESGERGEPDAAALLAGADRQGDREVRLAGPRRVGVALLIVLARCRSGCDWWRRRAGCVIADFSQSESGICPTPTCSSSSPGIDLVLGRE
jgi:hypothetical protein